MPRRILSIAGIIIVLIGGLYLLFEEYFDLHQPPVLVNLNRHIPARRVGGEVFEQLDTLSRWFARRLSIENKKIDFLMKSIDPDKFLKGDDETIRLLQNFITTTPDCLKVQLVSRELTILKSTGDKDVTGMMLDRDIYKGIFSYPSTNPYQVLFNPLKENLVFFRVYNKSRALLVHYSGSFLDPIFKNLYAGDYRGFRVLSPAAIVVNCPEYSESDEEKISNLKSIMNSEAQGVERLRLGGRMRYVYYASLTGEPYGLSIGVFFDKMPFKLSIYVISIFIVQLIAIVSLVMLLIQRVSSSRHVIGETFLRDKAESVKISHPGIVPPSEVITPDETLKTAEGEVIKTGSLSDMGLIPLEYLEEVRSIDEIGEAEVTQGDRGIAGTSADTQFEETLMQEQDAEEMPITGSTEVGEVSSLTSKETEEIGLSPSREERIFDDLGEIGKSREGKSTDLPELESLIKAGSGHRKAITPEERIQEVDSLIKQEEEKEAPEGGILSTDVETLSSTRGGVSKEGIYEDHDEELFDLINAVKEQDEVPLRELDKDGKLALFRRCMEEQGISKGALLLRDEDGIYRTAAMVGLNEQISETLSFSGKEKYFEKILLRGRILAISNPAALRGDMRSKFYPEDLSSLKRIFIIPIHGKKGTVPLIKSTEGLTKGESIEGNVWPKGIFIAFITDYKDYEDKYLVNKLIKIRKIIKSIL